MVWAYFGSYQKLFGHCTLRESVLIVMDAFNLPCYLYARGNMQILSLDYLCIDFPNMNFLLRVGLDLVEIVEVWRAPIKGPCSSSVIYYSTALSADMPQ